MGMYTELNLHIRLKADVPDSVVFALLRQGACDHAFFALSRRGWFQVNHVKGSLYSVYANLKNYESEIETFMDWIDPYLDHYVGELLGTWWYEEWVDQVNIYHGWPLELGRIEL